jgi:hypothetical protein
VTRPRFGKGDRVRCIDVATLGVLLELGKVYRVVDTAPPSLIKLDGIPSVFFSSSLFERAEP